MTDDRINLICGWVLGGIVLIGMVCFILFLGVSEHRKSMAALEKGVVWYNDGRTSGYRPAEKLPQ